ncbi:MAG: NosD domain-containing protein, partial [Halobacteriota archaeon]|nr:NosD domain-containing protein [Halobacteriota archaeon]
ASDNYYGIFLDFSSNNTLIGNTASNNHYGICLDHSDKNILTGNTADSNSYGIHLYDECNDNTLTGNTANSNNRNGIYLDHSDKNILTGNTADSNSYGIYLYDECNNNTLIDNTATDNRYGIYLFSSNDNNLIYNNYFINTNNAFDDGTNIWNITKTPGTNIIGGPYLGGNYWSDYAGEDTDFDGLGDTMIPYNADGGITDGGDYLPLVGARATKESAITKLESAKTGNRFVDREISQVIVLIKSSLDEDLWEDGMRLTPLLGDSVFNREYAAVDEMQDNLRRRWIPDDVKNVFHEVIGDLVSADDMLARTALQEAKAYEGTSEMVDLEIRLAEENLEEAYNEMEDPMDMDNAILRFKRAWEHAQRAIILASVPAGQDTQTPLPSIPDE